MKLHFLLLSFFLCSVIFAQKKSNKEFFLRGKTNISYGSYIYFKYVDSIGKTIYDSSLVVSNKFSFRGNVNVFYKKAIIYYKKETVNYSEFKLGIENKEIKVHLNLNDIQKSKVYGNITELLINNFYKRYAKRITTLQTKRDKKIHFSVADSLELEHEYVKLKSAISKFCITYPDDNVSTYLIFDNKNLFEDAEMLNLYEKLSFAQQKSYYGKYLEKSVNEYILQSSQIGLPVNNFSTVDLKGDSVELFEYTKRGVVLLDFWASWCSPCRESHPFLKKIYKAYHQLGLEIISVSADKQIDEIDWKNAIQEDSITSWIHILTNPASGDKIKTRLDLLPEYKIQFFPTQILIDKKNKVIARIENEAQLTDKLKEIFGYEIN